MPIVERRTKKGAIYDIRWWDHDRVEHRWAGYTSKTTTAELERRLRDLVACRDAGAELSATQRQWLSENNPHTVLNHIEDAIMSEIAAGGTARELSGVLNDAMASGNIPEGFRTFMLNRWLPVIQERNSRIEAFQAGA